MQDGTKTDLPITITTDLLVFLITSQNHDISIDPTLQRLYPTHGPNDPVPTGYIPAPSSFLQSDGPVLLRSLDPGFQNAQQQLAVFRDQLDRMERLMAGGLVPNLSILPDISTAPEPLPNNNSMTTELPKPQDTIGPNTDLPNARRLRVTEMQEEPSQKQVPSPILIRWTFISYTGKQAHYPMLMQKH